MVDIKYLLKAQQEWFSAITNSIQSKEIKMSKVDEHISLLGLKAKDKVTGFKGVVSCVTFDLYGCIQCCLSPKMDENGKVENGKWVDVTRLIVKPSALPVMTPPNYELGYGEQSQEKVEHIAEGRKGASEKPDAKF